MILKEEPRLGKRREESPHRLLTTPIYKNFHHHYHLCYHHHHNYHPVEAHAEMWRNVFALMQSIKKGSGNLLLRAITSHYINVEFKFLSDSHIVVARRKVAATFYRCHHFLNRGCEWIRIPSALCVQFLFITAPHLLLEPPVPFAIHADFQIFSLTFNNSFYHSSTSIARTPQRPHFHSAPPCMMHL